MVICAICDICIFVSSNHHPSCDNSCQCICYVHSLLAQPIRNSWRRKLDMVTVTIGVSYQTYYAFGSIQYNSLAILTYIILIGFSAGLYIISNYLMKCGRLWLAAYTHASIHIVANIANIVLYNSIENTKNNKYII